MGGHANPIDSKLRGCDVVALRVEDIAPNGYSVTMDGAGSREVCSDLSAFPRCGCRFIGKRLEAEFWNFLREIAYERQLSLSELINAISQAKSRKNGADDRPLEVSILSSSHSLQRLGLREKLPRRCDRQTRLSRSPDRAPVSTFAQT